MEDFLTKFNKVSNSPIVTDNNKLIELTLKLKDISPYIQGASDDIEGFFRNSTSMIMSTKSPNLSISANDRRSNIDVMISCDTEWTPEKIITSIEYSNDTGTETTRRPATEEDLEFFEDYIENTLPKEVAQHNSRMKMSLDEFIHENIGRESSYGDLIIDKLGGESAILQIIKSIASECRPETFGVDLLDTPKEKLSPRAIYYLRYFVAISYNGETISKAPFRDEDLAEPEKFAACFEDGSMSLGNFGEDASYGQTIALCRRAYGRLIEELNQCQ